MGAFNPDEELDENGQPINSSMAPSAPAWLKMGEPPPEPVAGPAEPTPEQILAQKQLEATQDQTQKMMTREGYLTGLRERLMNQGDAAAEGEGKRALGNALMKSAAQIGSFQGNVADTSSLDQFKKSLDEANRNRFNQQYKSYEGASKRLSDEQKDAESLRRHNESEQNKLLIGGAAAGIPESKKALIDAQTKKVEAETGQVGKAKPATLKAPSPTDYDSKVKALNSSERQRFDLVTEYYQAVNDLEAAMNRGGSRYSLVGDNEFTRALDRAGEAYGRMQSGGAINDQEGKKFTNSIRKFGDDVSMTRDKLKQANSTANQRLGSLGFSPSEIPALVESDKKLAASRSPVASPGPAPQPGAPPKPKVRFSPSQNKSEVTYPDGTKKYMDGDMRGKL